jgi:hypothetical protein
MSNPCILRPFSYGNEQGDHRLLDPNYQHANMLRRMELGKPLTREHVETFDQFQSTYKVEPTDLGLAFRGQQREWPLHSTYARRLDELPGFDPDNWPYRLRIEERDYYQFALEFIRANTASKDMVLPMARDMFMLISQHYGGPSTFLDWTLSPWNALYFAFDSVNPNSPDPVAIYMVDIGKMHHASFDEYKTSWHDKCDAANILETLAAIHSEFDSSWVFRKLSDFGDIRVLAQDAIVAQQRIMPNEPISLEDYVCPSHASTAFMAGLRPAPNGTLRIVTMPASEKFKVLDYVAAEHNVCHDTLFPDLSKLMKSIWEANVREHWERYEQAKEKKLVRVRPKYVKL